VKTLFLLSIYHCCAKLTKPSDCAGESPRRAKQLWRWMYYDHQWVSSFRETVGQQSGLSAAFCDKAERLSSVDGGLLLEQVVSAQDGTKKLVFNLTQGQGAGEGVLARGGGDTCMYMYMGPTWGQQQQRVDQLCWLRIRNKPVSLGVHSVQRRAHVKVCSKSEPTVTVRMLRCWLCIRQAEAAIRTLESS
jgi:hypothetical protein